MPQKRILIVDDAVVMRRLLTEALRQEPDMEIVGTASNGRIALQRLTQYNPDLVTLDVEMPELNGLETLREIRRTHPHLPVIMVSATTRQGAASTLEALANGASDYITKPSEVRDLHGSLAKLRADLVPRIRGLITPSPAPAPLPPPPRSSAPVPARPRSRGVGFDLVCLSTSTGGPNALADIFARFTRPLPVPVAIVQHMPPMFTAMLAERLDGGPGPMHCIEATTGAALQPGTAVLAPGGRHLAIERGINQGFVVRLTDTPPENSCRPAADVMLRTAAQAGARVLSVVMTGMGSDGAHGCQFVHEAGGTLLVQDQPSSVVWGMPGAVAGTGLPHEVLPLDQIAARIEQILTATPSSLVA
jgi:two-component system chemotaxis response regulator CheB